MSLAIKQTRFDGGELAPHLYGRTDHPLYAKGAKKIKNFIPTPQGSLARRPGTKYLGTTKNALAQLIPFQNDAASGWVIEIGSGSGGWYGYARFWYQGALLQGTPIAYAGAAATAGDCVSNAGVNYVAIIDVPAATAPPNATYWWPLSGTIYEIPVNIDPAYELAYAQAGNTISIVENDYGIVNYVSDLTLIGTTKWKAVNAAARPYATPHLVNASSAPTDATPTYNAANAYARGDRVRDVATGKDWIGIQTVIPIAAAPAFGSAYWADVNGQNVAGAPATHPPATWVWMSTVVSRNADGRVVESEAGATLTANLAVYPDRPLTLTLVPVATSGWTILYHRVYRGTNGIYGWIGDSASTTFIDRGQAPDYATRAMAASLYPTTGIQACVPGFFEQRRLFAATANTSQPFNGLRLIGSASGEIYRFDMPLPGKDSDAFEFTIAALNDSRITALVPLRSLLVMTDSGEWTLRGANGEAVSRSSVDFKRQSGWGSSFLQPVVVGNGCIFNVSRGRSVRDFFPVYGNSSEFWDGKNLSDQARHLFDSWEILSWAFQPVPHSVLWAASEKGLLSLTYDRQQEVVAWAQHAIGPDDGVVHAYSAATIRERVGNEDLDVLYMLVERGAYGSVERMIDLSHYSQHSRTEHDSGSRATLDQQRFLDCHTVFDGTVGGAAQVGSSLIAVPAATTGQLGAGATVAGTQLTFTASNPSFSATYDAGYDATVGDYQSAVIFDYLGDRVVCPIVAFSSTTVVTVELLADLTAAQIAAWKTAATLDWSIGRRKINYPSNALFEYSKDSGDPDGDRGVAAFADGVPISAAELNTTTLFSMGYVILPDYAVIACVGLSYNSDVETLALASPQVELRNKLKTITRLGIEVAGSRGLWVGQAFDDLVEWQQRTVDDGYDPIALVDTYFEEWIKHDWNKDGRVCLRQWEPLPLTVLSVLREFEIGGT